MMMTIGQREAGTQLTPVGQAPKVAVDSVRGHERPGFDCDDVKHGGHPPPQTTYTGLEMTPLRNIFFGHFGKITVYWNRHLIF